MAAIPNGGGDDINIGDLIGYHGTITKPPGEQTPPEAGVQEDVEAKVEAISGGWTETPHADPLEVLARAAALANDISSATRQWAGPGSERRMLEMIGALVTELTKRDREMLDLKARFDAEFPP